MTHSKRPYTFQRFRYSRVTLARLTPHFDKILNGSSPKPVSRDTGVEPTIFKELFESLRKQTFNNILNAISPKAISQLQDAGVEPVIPQELFDALRKHAFNNMPLRMISLLEFPKVKLVERNEVVAHIATKMAQAGVDADMLSKMKKTIDDLGSQPSSASELEEEEALEQEDVREHPLETIYQFLFGKFARFAILSHTWQSKEIVYGDTLPGAPPYQKRPEYQKVENFCRVAYEDHRVSFAWIDTLCIDKDSSSELDESIQSMYKWYRNSSVCITHLRDTTSFKDMHLDNWFKRGWTLQELLAPKHMQFYHGCSWTRLPLETSNADFNDKADDKIQDIIFNATGIEADELVSFHPLTGSDVATRMSWAASRDTTRGEDRAYSLMGIFGVNFSTSYGEGAERAFFRLIEAIISSRPTSHVIQVLDWGGDAISNTIHTSRLIPSQPECYLFEEPRAVDKHPIAKTAAYFPILLEPMSLTHLGLRVRLLLIQVHVESVHLHYDLTRKSGPFDLTMKLKFPPQSFETAEILLQKRFAERPSQISAFYDSLMPTHSSSIFVGIFAFGEDDTTDCVHIPFSSTAIILGIPTPCKDFRISALSSKHFGPTSKIDTRKPIRVCQNISNNSARKPISTTFQKESLITMEMTLLNMYL